MCYVSLHVQVGIQGENPLVREVITLSWCSRSPHLMTQVTTDVGLCPHFGLHGFSRRPPRDAKNCHALEMVGAQQWPQVALSSVTPNTMHMGTNRKAQQSSGSGTNRE